MLIRDIRVWILQEMPVDFPQLAECAEHKMQVTVVSFRVCHGAEGTADLVNAFIVLQHAHGKVGIV